MQDNGLYLQRFYYKIVGVRHSSLRFTCPIQHKRLRLTWCTYWRQCISYLAPSAALDEGAVVARRIHFSCRVHWCVGLWRVPGITIGEYVYNKHQATHVPCFETKLKHVISTHWVNMFHTIAEGTVVQLSRNWRSLCWRSTSLQLAMPAFMLKVNLVVANMPEFMIKVNLVVASHVHTRFSCNADSMGLITWSSRPGIATATLEVFPCRLGTQFLWCGTYR